MTKDNREALRERLDDILKKHSEWHRGPLRIPGNGTHNFSLSTKDANEEILSAMDEYIKGALPEGMEVSDDDQIRAAYADGWNAALKQFKENLK